MNMSHSSGNRPAQTKLRQARLECPTGWRRQREESEKRARRLTQSPDIDANSACEWSRLTRLARAQTTRQKALRTVFSPMRWFVFVASLLLSLQTFAATPFDQANQDYAAGNFKEAARGFEQVIAQQGYSAPVLFNLGNAWLKAGEPGRAILNYERARVLAPRNDAITRNLGLAREQAGVAVPVPGTLERAAQSLSWNALTWAGIGALLVTCASIFLARLRPSLPRGGLGFLTASGACALVLAASALAVRWPELDRAVVLAPDAPARIAPANAAAVSFSLPGGETVRAQQAHGGFVLVRTADGRSGWVSEAQVARIMASDQMAQS